MRFDLNRQLKRLRDRENRQRSLTPSRSVVLDPGTPERYKNGEKQDPPPEPAKPTYKTPARFRFRDLIDAPGTFAGAGGQVVTVTEGEDGLEFADVDLDVEAAPYREPLTSGDTVEPSLLFAPNGDVIMGEVTKEAMAWQF